MGGGGGGGASTTARILCAVTLLQKCYILKINYFLCTSKLQPCLEAVSFDTVNRVGYALMDSLVSLSHTHTRTAGSHTHTDSLVSHTHSLVSHTHTAWSHTHSVLLFWCHSKIQHNQLTLKNIYFYLCKKQFIISKLAYT